MTNMQALSDFVTHLRLERDPFGRCRFRADVTIKAGGRGGTETLGARISFASGDGEQLTLENGAVLEAGKLPLGYRTDFGEWSQIDGVLTIRGNYRGLFDYQTEITVES